MFTTTRLGNYTPLAWLSYAIDYSFWGLKPVGYHLTNLLLHSVNAVLFYRLARPLLRGAFPGAEARAIEAGAVVAALAFAAHPLRVESVAWASERRDVLAGAFYLSTLIFYVKAALRRDERESFRLRACSVACFAAAALSKATVVPLPAALLALDFYPLKRIGAGERAGELRARLVEKIPYVLIAAAAAFVAVRAQLAHGDLVAAAEHGLSSRLAQALYGAGFYVRRTLLPTGLYALYPLDRRSALALPALESVALIAAVVCACGALGVERKAQAALWAYYIALLLPVSGLLQNGPQLVALRYSYLSCLGWALLAGAAAVRAVQDRKKSRLRGAAALGALALWLASDAWAVQRQIALWRDDEALWGRVLSRYPLSPDANMNMAEALLRKNEPAAAEAFARIAARIEPDARAATLTLAEILSAQDRLPEAREVLERRLRSDPDWGEAQALLGVVLAREGRDGEALPRLQRAAALLPSSAEAQSNAGSALALRGRYAEAIPYFEKAARIDPSNPSYAGRLEQARRDLQQVRINGERAPRGGGGARR
jgi:tetratricopeptide (TPR) repeat protein